MVILQRHADYMYGHLTIDRWRTGLYGVISRPCAMAPLSPAPSTPRESG